MQRSFSIITVSKSRLEHVKLSLPKMLAQGAREVIVVDYCCPQGTGDFIETHFPSARLVRAEGEEHFSNWRARNLGASAATGDVLVFCDADTIMAEGALAWISDNLPEHAYGHFNAADTALLDQTRLRLAQNQLRGFLVIPAAAFRRLGGYDEVLVGYAAGGDTDLADRLRLARVMPFAMDPKIIESVVPHDNTDRTRHHADPIPLSYGAGLLYRSAKLALLRLRNRLNLPLPARERLYQAARNAARQLGPGRDTVAMTVNVHVEQVGMPRQLGFQKGKQTLSLRVEVSMQDRLPSVPD